MLRTLRFPAALSELDISRQMRYAELAENEPCKNGADDSAKSAEKTVVLRWLGLLGVMMKTGCVGMFVLLFLDIVVLLVGLMGI